MAAIGSMIVLLLIVSVLPIIVICLAYPYMALRLRDSREEKRDPELGIKTAYYLILSAAILLILFGLTISAIDVMDGTLEKRNRPQPQPQAQFQQQQRDPFERIITDAAQRTAWGMTVSGLLFALTSMLLLKMGTNDIHYPSAKRVFVGGRLAFVGIVVMIAVTALIILFFQKEVPRKEPYEVIIAVLMVWAPALAVHIFLMRLYASQPYYDDRTTSRSSRRGRQEQEYLDDDD